MPARTPAVNPHEGLRCSGPGVAEGEDHVAVVAAAGRRVLDVAGAAALPVVRGELTGEPRQREGVGDRARPRSLALVVDHRAPDPELAAATQQLDDAPLL